MPANKAVIDPELHRALESMNRADSRRNKRIREHETVFSDLEYEPTTPAPSGWQGPRLHFSHLIGEGAIWDGPPEPGRFCHGRRLGPGEYCLDCERSGKDAIIPSPGEVPHAAHPHRVDGLKGGTGQ